MNEDPKPITTIMNTIDALAAGELDRLAALNIIARVYQQLRQDNEQTTADHKSARRLIGQFLSQNFEGEANVPGVGKFKVPQRRPLWKIDAAAILDMAGSLPDGHPVAVRLLTAVELKPSYDPRVLEQILIEVQDEPEHADIYRQLSSLAYPDGYVDNPLTFNAST